MFPYFSALFHPRSAQLEAETALLPIVGAGTDTGEGAGHHEEAELVQAAQFAALSAHQFPTGAGTLHSQLSPDAV